MFNWTDLVNSGCSALLLIMCVAVSNKMSHIGFWFHKLGFAAVIFILALQALSPLLGDQLNSDILQAAFNFLVFCGAVTMRKEIMIIVDVKLGAEPALDQLVEKAHELPRTSLNHVPGGIQSDAH